MLLELEGITRSFPGVKALAGVSFDVKPGEVHALMGENGAGKSTLMRVIGGVLPPDAGAMRLRGEPYAPSTPHEAKHKRIGFVHQELSLVPEMTVAENLLLGRLPHRWGWVDRAEVQRQARAALATLELEMALDVPVKSLNVGQCQMIEIARAIYSQADVLIMDEPTAALSHSESVRLFAAIRRLRASGAGIIYISHRMEEVYDLSDRITILRDGKSVGTWPLTEITPNQVVTQMVGRELEAAVTPDRPAAGATVLSVSHITRQDVVRDVSFEVCAGEVVGLAGLVGAGRTEIARLIAGADPLELGEICVNEKPVRLTGPADAVARGVGLVPEDRKQQGLVLGMSVEENLSLTCLRALSRRGVLDRGRCRELANHNIAEMRIRTPSPDQAVGTLSGGNQQKVVMGKWLARDCQLLILDEPTRGVDVGAKEEIYRLVEQLVSQGRGVLLISSEMPELLRLSDRVLVISHGRKVAEYARAEATPERILEAALSR